MNMRKPFQVLFNAASNIKQPFIATVIFCNLELHLYVFKYVNRWGMS